MRRRTFLKAVGGSAALGAGAYAVGTAVAPNLIEFKLFHTKGVEIQSRINTDDGNHALKVAKDYARYTFGNLAEASSRFDGVKIRVETEPQQLDTDFFPAILRVTEWEERVDHMDDRGRHGNLLLDTGYLDRSAGGIAFALNLLNVDCDGRGDDSSAALINGGNFLSHLPRGDPIPSRPIVVDDEPYGDREKSLGRYYAGSVVHELGHLLCAPHVGGNAWTGAETPKRHKAGYSVPDDAVVSSVMMGLYALSFSYMPPTNLCDEEIELIDSVYDHLTGEITFLDDWHQSYHLSDCNKERILNAAHNAENR